MTARVSQAGWASLFRVAFEHSDNPMILFRRDRVIAAINRALETSYGYSREELVGRRADLLAPPEHLKQLEADWETLERRGGVYGDRELVRADGSRVEVQFAGHRETVGGHQLALWVQLEQHLRPVTLEHPGNREAKPLSPRELEVTAGIAMGQRTHDIARDLFIAPTTVRTHVRNAMAKAGAHSQAQLVAIALSTGALDVRRFQEIVESRS